MISQNAGVTESFINNLMGQSSITNRMRRTANMNPPTEQKVMNSSNPFITDDLPPNCLDTNFGFQDLINRESDNCFVERIDT